MKKNSWQLELRPFFLFIIDGLAESKTLYYTSRRKQMRRVGTKAVDNKS